MMSKGCKARFQGVRSADSLKPGWDPLIIHVRVITAVAADDLEQACADGLRGYTRPRPIAPARWLSCHGRAGQQAGEVPGGHCGATSSAEHAARAMRGRHSDEDAV